MSPSSHDERPRPRASHRRNAEEARAETSNNHAAAGEEGVAKLHALPPLERFDAPAASRHARQEEHLPERQSQSSQRVGSQSHEGLRRIKKKKRKKLSRAVLIAAGVFVALFASAGILFAWQYSTLSSNLAYTGDYEKLQAALTEPEFGYQEPFYVLVIGSDKWQNYGARSDVMLLVRVDIENAVMTMVSVPRDTNYMIDGRKVKLNQAYAEGGEVACIQAVSEVTGVPIAHFVQVEFDQLESVVDALGGILVDVPYAIDYTVYTHDRPTVHVDSGPQVLTGEMAVALARERVSYANPDDAVRQVNIRAMMVAMIKQVLSSPVNELPGKVQTLASMVSTDIPINTIIDWALKLNDAPSTTLYTCTGPYAGGNDAETSLWLTYDAPESWAALMAAVDAGENPEHVLSYTDGGGLSFQNTEVIEQPS